MSLASASLSLLRDTGKTYTLARVAAGAYNPATGAAALTTTQSTFVGKLISYRDADIDGALIQRGDRRLLIAAASLAGGVVPQTDDRVSGDGAEMMIVSVQKIEEGASVVIYACQVRT